MKFTRKLLCMASVFAISAFAFAQDGDYEEEPFEPKLTIGGSAEVNARSWVDARDANGERAEVNATAIEGNPSLKINFDYEGTSSIFTGKLKFEKNSLQSGYYWDMLDEFKATAILGNWTLEAGKMRLVWGKTDKLHVLDNFNANDYTDYIFPDYNDRRIAEPMFHIVYATPFSSNLKFELVYTPVMTADRLGTGYWEPKAAKALTGNVKTMAMNSYAEKVRDAEDARIFASELKTLKDSGNNTALVSLIQQKAATLVPYGLDTTNLMTIAGTAEKATENYLNSAVTAQNLALTNLSSLSSDSSFLYPNTKQLEYGQAGFRNTFSVGPLDLGLSYYYGHLKQPSFNALKFKSTMDKYIASGSMGEDDKFLSYDKVQIFGLEGAFITPWWLGSLNTRFEFAYNMTDDKDGTDPFIHNNSLNWVAGFDRDIPIHNVNINIQTQGKYILHGDRVNDNNAVFGKSVNPLVRVITDVDSDGKDCYTNNKIVLDLTDTWYYENVKLDVKAIYGIERKDFVLMPALITRIAGGNVTVTLSGLFMWCKDENSEFDGWEHNSFAQLGVKYNF
ncbi:MAG: hypothetical protein MJZ50_09645 [Treponema sp.]|nr:hypothetical protein [Treponema sp.]